MKQSLSSRYSDPSSEDQSQFALRLYFGDGDNKLRLAIRRAYLDFSRTVHGIGNYQKARREADDFMCCKIAELAMKQDDANQASFDAWHKKTATKLCDIYSVAEYKNFHVGQAQKWINMALKYVYVFGESRLPGFARFFPYCHVPIDNIILKNEEFKNLPPFEGFKCAWSRISNYEDYMAFQLAVRRKFPDSSPLAAEFWVWQRNSAV